MIVLAVENLYNAVRESFAADQINAENVFGWRSPAQYTSDLPRCAWVPGDDGGGLGELGAPRGPGQEPRSLANLAELFTVYLTAADPRDAENEQAQYHAARFLYEAWYRAMYRAAHGTFRVRSQRWVTDQTIERSYGATLRVVCEVQAPIVDALPDEPLVGGAYAGLADAVGVNVPTGHINIDLVTETESITVTPPTTPPIGSGDGGTSGGTGGIVSSLNKQMPCLVTTHDGDLATGIAVQAVPAPNAYISAVLSGWTVTNIGNGSRIGCVFYFSNDDGASACPWSAIRIGTTIHFNGSVAGQQLDTSDVLDLIFEGA